MEIGKFFNDLHLLSFHEIFNNYTSPWSILDSCCLNNYINRFFQSVNSYDNHADYKGSLDLCSIESGHIGRENILTVLKPCVLKENLIIKEFSIFIGKGSVLEPSAVIKGNTIIGEDCHIRQGAYVRGNVLTGKACVLGHVTELKNSILLNHVEAGHFAYIGDSIIGSHANLGAGTKLANLQLRGKEEKDSGNINPIMIKLNNEVISTNRKKLGAVLGDYVEVGCNTVTSPAAFIGMDSWIYPNTTVKKGYYPPGSIIKM